MFAPKIKNKKYLKLQLSDNLTLKRKIKQNLLFHCKKKNYKVPNSDTDMLGL